MSINVSATIGSGTLPFTRSILSAAQRGFEPLGEGNRFGQQVVVANPEDLNSVDAFATSGISVSTGLTLIWGPHTNPLPRQRTITIRNTGPDSLYIGNNANAIIAPSGLEVTFASTPGAGSLGEITLPFLHNVEVWARSTGLSQITILAY